MIPADMRNAHAEPTDERLPKTTFVALLRAVNVGGTGRLPMSDLVAMAHTAGFAHVRTYIASGNLLCESASSEVQVKELLEDALATYAGKHVSVAVRPADELASVLAANPFPEAAPAHTVAIFLDAPPPGDLLDHVVAPGGEEVRAGLREIYVHYPAGMGTSKLKLPAAKAGTARNMNTLRRLVGMTEHGRAN